MDTRLRSVSYSSWLKLLAVVVTVAGALLTCYGLLEAPDFPYAFQAEIFSDSQEQQVMLYQAGQMAHQLTTREREDSVYYLQRLSKPYAFDYYATRANGEVITNVDSFGEDAEQFFLALPASAGFIFDGRQLYVGLPEKSFAAAAEDYSEKKARGIAGLYTAVGGLLLSLFGGAYVLYSAGNTSSSQEIRLTFVDRLYLDVSLLVSSGLTALGLRALLELARVYYEVGAQASLVLGGLLIAFITLLVLMWLSMAVKRIKRKEFLKHTLVYASLTWFFGLFAKAYRGATQTGPLGIRAAVMIIGYSAAITISILLILVSYASRSAFLLLISLGVLVAVGMGGLSFVTRRATELRTILAGVEKIKVGELTHRIPETGYAELAQLAASVNTIASGLNAAVENEVKSERMKAELITNVSHDLKTPLTSIITYIDLLKTEGLDSENGAKYLGVLEQKSQRLKVLTDDLFEAAKAASGSLELRLETLDVGALLTQGLGELSDRIDSSGLDLRVDLPEERITLKADGRLLWRALENVLCNALKYSLPGSRIYVSAARHDGKVRLTFKNVSATPLNIPPDELLERFKRGDDSRSSEGSGLGLAIAKSLVELQGGSFKLDIDGDLFKVTIVMPTSYS